MLPMALLHPDSALARALARGRDRLNARAALARRAGLAFDPSALARHLVDGVAPAVEAVAAAAPDHVDAVTEVLFALSLDLVAREWVGPGCRLPAVDAAWRTLLPRLARPLAEAPQWVAASLTNAAFHLASEPGARAEEWLAGLGEVAGGCAGAGELLAAGQVLAWRAGMAHLRASALEVWERLPDPLARATLGLSPDAPEPRDALRRALADPWHIPGTPPGPAALRMVPAVGGFRGFGGPFLAPPRVHSDGARLWAVDGDDAYLVHADCFGETVRRAPAGQPPVLRGSPAPRGATLELDGTLTFRGLTARLPELAGARGLAAAGALLAATRRDSHRILLVARSGGNA